MKKLLFILTLTVVLMSCAGSQLSLKSKGYRFNQPTPMGKVRGDYKPYFGH